MNKYFENVFVINRSIDKARMEKTDSILSKNNIKYKRFEAVVIKEDVNTHVTNEMLGCGLSHRNIWEYVVDNKLENVLIFEDDMFLVDEWEMQLNKTMNDLPKDWDIFTLGCFGIKDPSDMYKSPFNFIFYNIITLLGLNNKKNKSIKKNIMIPYFFTGLYGYAVSYKGAKKLLSLINDINFHIDVLISCKSENLNIYSMKKDIVYQRIETSTINTTNNVTTNEKRDVNLKIHLDLLDNIIDDKNIKYNYYMNVPVYKLRITKGYNVIVNGWFILFSIILLIFLIRYKIKK
jgi:GR25 family glycosyltransferase involved in LPS biosynthesis